MLSVSFWHEADIEEARIGATPNVRFAAASLKGRLAAEGREHSFEPPESGRSLRTFFVLGDRATPHLSFSQCGIHTRR